MRITVAPSGEVVIDTNGTAPADVAALLRELRGPGDGATTRPRRTRRASAPAAPPVEAEQVDLPPVLFATWAWLVEHDVPEGHRVADIAAGLGAPSRAVGQRLVHLVTRGVAHRPGAGRYRAGESGAVG